MKLRKPSQFDELDDFDELEFEPLKRVSARRTGESVEIFVMLDGQDRPVSLRLSVEASRDLVLQLRGLIARL